MRWVWGGGVGCFMIVEQGCMWIERAWKLVSGGGIHIYVYVWLNAGHTHTHRDGGVVGWGVL